MRFYLASKRNGTDLRIALFAFSVWWFWISNHSNGGLARTPQPNTRRSNVTHLHIKYQYDFAWIHDIPLHCNEWTNPFQPLSFRWSSLLQASHAIYFSRLTICSLHFRIYYMPWLSKSLLNWSRTTTKLVITLRNIHSINQRTELPFLSRRRQIFVEVYIEV